MDDDFWQPSADDDFFNDDAQETLMTEDIDIFDEIPYPNELKKERCVLNTEKDSKDLMPQRLCSPQKSLSDSTLKLVSPTTPEFVTTNKLNNIVQLRDNDFSKYLCERPVVGTRFTFAIFLKHAHIFDCRSATYNMRIGKSKSRLLTKKKSSER